MPAWRPPASKPVRPGPTDLGTAADGAPSGRGVGSAGPRPDSIRRPAVALPKGSFPEGLRLAGAVPFHSYQARIRQRRCANPRRELSNADTDPRNQHGKSHRDRRFGPRMSGGFGRSRACSKNLVDGLESACTPTRPARRRASRTLAISTALLRRSSSSWHGISTDAPFSTAAISARLKPARRSKQRHRDSVRLGHGFSAQGRLLRCCRSRLPSGVRLRQSAQAYASTRWRPRDEAVAERKWAGRLPLRRAVGFMSPGGSAVDPSSEAQ